MAKTAAKSPRMTKTAAESARAGDRGDQLGGGVFRLPTRNLGLLGGHVFVLTLPSGKRPIGPSGPDRPPGPHRQGASPRWRRSGMLARIGLAAVLGPREGEGLRWRPRPGSTNRGMCFDADIWRRGFGGWQRRTNATLASIPSGYQPAECQRRRDWSPSP